MSLYSETVAALDRIPPEQGVIVCTAGGRLLADRDPLDEEAGVVIVALGVEPFCFPDALPQIRADQRRPAAREPREAPNASADVPSGPSQPSTTG